MFNFGRCSNYIVIFSVNLFNTFRIIILWARILFLIFSKTSFFFVHSIVILTLNCSIDAILATLTRFAYFRIPVSIFPLLFLLYEIGCSLDTK